MPPEVIATISFTLRTDAVLRILLTTGGIVWQGVGELNPYAKVENLMS
jgi:hypothetical protein